MRLVVRQTLSHNLKKWYKSSWANLEIKRKGLPSSALRNLWAGTLCVCASALKRDRLKKFPSSRDKMETPVFDVKFLFTILKIWEKCESHRVVCKHTFSLHTFCYLGSSSSDHCRTEHKPASPHGMTGLENLEWVDSQCLLELWKGIHLIEGIIRSTQEQTEKLFLFTKFYLQLSDSRNLVVNPWVLKPHWDSKSTL